MLVFPKTEKKKSKKQKPKKRKHYQFPAFSILHGGNIMKAATGQSYRKRLTRVLDYVFHHLDGNLDVNVLAEVACMSPYHFHRIYRKMAGETINMAVRRLRLQQAAADLIRTDLPITILASKVAYGSVEAFSRAFTKQFGETPGEYRQGRAMHKADLLPFVAMLGDTQLEHENMYQVDIKQIEEAQLMGYEHQGSYMNIGNAFEKLYLYAGSHGLLNENSRSIGLFYGDPQSVSADELRSVACVSVAGIPEDNMAANNESAPQAINIPSGKYATILFKGSYAELQKPYDWFFGQWLEKTVKNWQISHPLKNI